jgi:uncharacterized delta-60 repeat protein
MVGVDIIRMELVVSFPSGCARMKRSATMNEITRFFDPAGQGEDPTAEKLLPLVYDELRKLAARKMANEAAYHTLQPTSLVHEARLRLHQSNFNNMSPTNFMAKFIMARPSRVFNFSHPAVVQLIRSGALLFVVFGATLVWSQTGSVDTNFTGDRVAEGPSLTVAVQPDGLVLVGGYFRLTNATFVARLNADGSPDSQFNPGAGPDGSVSSILLEPEGKILIGGNFSTVDGVVSIGVARLNSDGTLDTNFASGLTSSSIQATKLALQADGKILVTDFDGLFRLLPDGARDVSFSSLSSYQLLTNADGSVMTQNLQINQAKAMPDGGILVAGFLPAIAGAYHGGLVRLDTNGAYDPGFSAPIPAVDAFAFTPGGKIVLSVNVTNDFNVHQLMRLNADGTVDASFQHSVTMTGAVRGLKLQADGKVLVCGDFRQAGDLRRVGLVRFNTDGTLDQGMDTGFNDNTQIMDFALQADQKILLAGWLNWPDTFSTKYLLRLFNDSPSWPGRLEFGQGHFHVGENAGTLVVPVYRVGGTNGSITVQYATQLGTALAGIQYTPKSGMLSFAAGQTSNFFSVPVFDDHVVQTNEQNQTFLLQLTGVSAGASLGSQSGALVTIADVDTALQFAAPSVSALEADSSANITVTRLGFPQTTISVSYATSDGTAQAGRDYISQSGLLTLNPGELTKTFAVPLLHDSFESPVETVLLSLKNPGGGATLGGLSNATLRIVETLPGVPDASFVPATNFLNVNLITPLGDGRIIVLGNFAQPAGGYGQQFVRLNRDGSLDPTYNSPVLGGGSVNCCALQPDGKLLVGGYAISSLGNFFGNLIRFNQNGSLDTSFSSSLNNGGPSAAFLALQADGKILVIGMTSTFFRLNADGSPDSSFVPFPNGPVSDFLLQSDGKVWICGSFTQVNGTAEPGLARLNADGSLDTNLVTGVSISPFSPPDFPHMLLQSDGKLLVEGWLQTSSQSYSFMLVRLNVDGSVDSSFATNYTGGSGPGGPGLRAIQADNKVLLAKTDDSLTRLNADGTPDSTFNAGTGATNGFYAALTVDADGSILVGGTFSFMNGIPRPGLARLANDGASAAGRLELNPSSISAIEGVVTNLTLRVKRSTGSNGVVSVNYGVSGGTAIAGVNFAPIAGTVTFADGDAQDKQILISVLDDGLATEDRTIRMWLANALGGAVVGSAGEALVTIVDHDVNIQLATNTLFTFQDRGQLDVQVERKGRLQDSFSVSYASSDGTATSPKDYMAQSGTLVFGPGQTNQTISIPVFNDNWPEQDRDFSLTLSAPSSGAGLVDPFSSVITIINVNRPGSLDSGFDVNRNLSQGALGLFEADALAVQPDGGLVVAGQFQTTKTSLSAVARFLPNGVLDPTFKLLPIPFASFFPVPLGVHSLVLQPDGKILVGGSGFISTSVAAYLVRLNTDGTPDAGFTNGLTQFQSIDLIALQADGRILVGGSSVPFGFVGFTHPLLARLGSTGQLDPSFNASPALTNQFAEGGALRALLVQPDQRVLVAGDFYGVTNLFRSELVRLMADGQIDTTFSPGLIFGSGPFPVFGVNGSIDCLALQPDGKLLAGGNFTFVDGQLRQALARFNTDGTLDSSFIGSANWPQSRAFRQITSMALQPDGRIMVAGWLALPNYFGTAVGRINQDGSLDPFFDSSGGFMQSSLGNASLNVLTNGEVLFAGEWFSMNGLGRSGLARFRAGDVLAFESLRRTPQEQTSLSFTAPAAGSILEWSGDLVHWLPLNTNSWPSGASTFADTNAQTAIRFYRLRFSKP